MSILVEVVRSALQIRVSGLGRTTVVVCAICVGPRFIAGCSSSSDATERPRSSIDGGEAGAPLGADGGDAGDGAPVVTQPPADTPRPTRTDDCTFAGARGDITTLVPGGTNAGHLVVDDQYVYFVEENSVCLPFGNYGCGSNATLHRIPRCGGALENVGSALTMSWEPGGLPAFPNRMAEGGGYVYVRSGDLMRVRSSDTSIAHLSLGNDTRCVSGIAANATHVFVYDRCQQAILRAAHDATELTLFAQADRGDLLAIGTHVLYFDIGSEVWWRDVDSGTTGLLYDASSAPLLDIAVADGAAFVVEGADAVTVRRVPLVGGSPTGVPTGSTAALGLSYLPPYSWVATEHGSGYFQHLGKYFVPEVARMSDASGALEPELRRTYADLALYGERMYWTEGGGLFTALPQPPVPAGPASTKTPVWGRRYGVEPNQESFLQVAVAPDGTVAVAGTTAGTTNLGGGDLSPAAGESRTAFVAKLSATGAHLWSQTVDGPGGTQPVCLLVDSAGGITVAVDEMSAPAQLAFHTYTADGTSTAVAREPDPGLVNCVRDASGNLYLSLNQALVTMRNSSGTKLWQNDLSQYGSENASIALAPQGVVVATGNSGPSPTDTTNAIARIAAADGTLIWARTFHPGNVHRIQADGTGRVLVVGDTGFPIDAGNGAIALPRPGENFTFLLWIRNDGTVESLRYLDGSFMYGDAALAQDGSIYLLAGQPERPFYFDPPNSAGNYVYGITFAKLDKSGNLIYSSELTPYVTPSVPSGYYELWGSLAVTPDRVMVAGWVDHYSNFPDSSKYDGSNQIYDAFAARFDP